MRDFKAAFKTVTSLPEVIEKDNEVPGSLKRVKKICIKERRRIVGNLNKMINDFKLDYKRLVREVFENLGEEIKKLPYANTHGGILDNYILVPEPVMFKYTSAKSGKDDVDNNHLRYSSFDYLKKQNDSHEAEMFNLDVFNERSAEIDIIRRTIQDTKVRSEFHPMKVVENIQTIIGRNYFVGCLCEDEDSSYMWDNYANNGGYCIGFDIKERSFHKVTYHDSPVDVDYFIDEYNKIVDKIRSCSYDSFRDDIIRFLKEIICVSFMFVYTKRIHKENGERTMFDEEHEWREIIPIYNLGDAIMANDKQSIYVDYKGKIDGYRINPHSVQ